MFKPSDIVYIKWKEYIVVSNDCGKTILRRGTPVKIIACGIAISLIQYSGCQYYIANKALTRYKLVARLDRINDKKRDAKYKKLLESLK